jgi:hypothetical protein
VGKTSKEELLLSFKGTRYSSNKSENLRAVLYSVSAVRPSPNCDLRPVIPHFQGKLGDYVSRLTCHRHGSTKSQINLSMSLEGPSFLPFSISTLSVAAASITFGLVLYQRWFLLHEVMSLGIMVCVTLNLKTFEYVHLIPLFLTGAWILCLST